MKHIKRMFAVFILIGLILISMGFFVYPFWRKVNEEMYRKNLGDWEVCTLTGYTNNKIDMADATRDDDGINQIISWGAGYVMCVNVDLASGLYDLLWSTDLITWTQSIQINLLGIAWDFQMLTKDANYVYFVVGKDDNEVNVYRSADGTTWALWLTTGAPPAGYDVWRSLGQAFWLDGDLCIAVNMIKASPVTAGVGIYNCMTTTWYNVEFADETDNFSRICGFVENDIFYFFANGNHYSFNGTTFTLELYDAAALYEDYVNLNMFKVNNDVFFFTYRKASGSGEPGTQVWLWKNYLDYDTADLTLLADIDDLITYPLVDTDQQLVGMITTKGSYILHFEIGTNGKRLLRDKIASTEADNWSTTSMPASGSGYMPLYYNGHFILLDRNSTNYAYHAVRYDEIDFDPDFFQIRDRLLQPREALFQYPSADFTLLPGVYLWVFSDADVELIDGCIVIEQSDPDAGIYHIRDKAAQDLNDKYTVSFAAKKSHEMINTLITDHFNFLTGTIADDSFVAWTISFSNTKGSEILETIQNHEYRLFKLTLRTCTFIASPLAGAAVESYDKSNITSEITVKKESYAISQVIITGKLSGGVYATGTWINADEHSDSEFVLHDAYPNAEDAELDIIAEAIGSQFKNQISIYSFESDGTKPVPGDKVEICYGIQGIGADDANGDPDTYDSCLVREVKEIDFGHHWVEIVSAFVFSNRNREDSLQGLINQQRIEANSAEIATKAGSLGDLGITATNTEINTACDGSTAKNSHTHDDRYYTETEINATKVAFSLGKTTAQSVSDATFEPIEFNVENYDLGSNVSSYTFTVPTTGVYHFDASCCFASTSWSDGEICDIKIEASGGSFRQNRYNVTGAETMYLVIQISCDMYLTAGETVQAYIYQTSGGMINTYTGQHYNYFNGHRVY